MLLACGGRAKGGTRLVSQGHSRDEGCSGGTTADTSIPITHRAGTAHILIPAAGTVGAMGCSAMVTGVPLCHQPHSIPWGDLGKGESGPNWGAAKGSGMGPHTDYTTDIPATRA